MISTQTFINITIVFLLTIVFGYLLGLAIVNTVDRRLSDISINMPKINLPRQNIQIKLAPKSISNHSNLDSSFESVQINNQFTPYRAQLDQSFQLKSPQSPIKPLKPTPIHEGFVNPNDTDLIQPTQIPSQPTSPNPNVIIDPDVDLVKIKSKLPKPPLNSNIKCEKDSDCNVVFGNGQNKCLSSGQCYCNSGSGTFCHYGPTYYKDPKDLTDRQVQKFKYKANFDKMTVQDYYNWLMLFEDEPEKLAPRHLYNLKQIQKGIRLELKDVPRERLPPPLSAQDYFDQLYTFDDRIHMYTPQISDTTGLQIPSNFTEYSEFAPVKNLKHLNVRPLTMEQEIDKLKSRQVLESVQPQISHEWSLATGTSADPTGQSQEKNRDIVKKLRSQISHLDDYPEN